jgi:hypothetical protein
LFVPSIFQTLESELMSQQHSNEKLQAECSRLQAQCASAVASSIKQKQQQQAALQRLHSSPSTATLSSAQKHLFGGGTMSGYTPGSVGGSGRKNGRSKRDGALDSSMRSSNGSSVSYASTVIHASSDGEEEEDEDEEEDGNTEVGDNEENHADAEVEMDNEDGENCRYEYSNMTVDSPVATATAATAVVASPSSAKMADKLSASPKRVFAAPSAQENSSNTVRLDADEWDRYM